MPTYEGLFIVNDPPQALAHCYGKQGLRPNVGDHPFLGLQPLPQLILHDHFFHFPFPSLLLATHLKH